MRRRHVFRVAGIYIVAAWVIIQVCDIAFESFGLPTQAMRFVWFALVAIFPLAVFWGWRYDITPQGIVRTPPAMVEGTADLKLRTPDFVIISALAVVVLFVATATVNEVLRSPQGIDQRYALSRDVLSSIVVLPFENLSPDSSQRYLAAGMHDALIASLAKVNAFKVISRTSSLRLPETLTIPEIGEQLGVDKVIEGTVIREEDKVRVSVQLIDAERAGEGPAEPLVDVAPLGAAADTKVGGPLDRRRLVGAGSDATRNVLLRARFEAIDHLGAQLVELVVGGGACNPFVHD